MKITDCHDMALKGEPTFTLLARDRTAPKTITTWADGRRTILCQEASARLRDVITDSNIDIFAKDGSLDRRERAELDKINTAYAIAQSMELWRGGEIDQAAKENREVSWRQARPIAMSPALAAGYSEPVVGNAGKLDTYEAVAASILEPKKADNFESESPIRAFTQFQVSGEYAIGKGFRPSLTHLAHYLDAMLNREAWELVQIILPENDAQDPTMVFRRTQPVVLTVNDPVMPELRKAAKTSIPDFGAPHDQLLWVRVKPVGGKARSAIGIYTKQQWFFASHVTGEEPALKPIREPLVAWKALDDEGWHTVDPKPSDDIALPISDDIGERIRELAKLDKPLARSILAEFNCHSVTDLVNRPEVREKALWTINNALSVERNLQAIDRHSPEAEVTSDDDDIDNHGRKCGAHRGFACDCKDDPLHPAHYGGDECMQIIEHMPTNVGIAVKYLWRLGKKDEPRQELGKAIEYLRRELRMARDPRNRWSVFGINAEDMADYKAMTRRHIAARFGPESDWQAITLHRLVHYTITGAADSVDYAIERIERAMSEMHERAMSEMHDHGHGLAL